MYIRSIVILLLLLHGVMAVPIIDVTNGEEIRTALVHIESGNSSSDLYVNARQDLTLMRLDQPTLALVRAFSNDTYDYYARLEPGTPNALIVRPAGLVNGEAIDAQSNLIAGAQATITCPSYQTRLLTDETGQFHIFLPAEECTVSIAFHSHAGSKTVQVLQGKSQHASISVDRSIEPADTPVSSRPILIYVILAVLLLGAIGAVLFLRKQHKHEPFLAEQMKPALKTKEELIVDEIMLRGGRARLSELRTAVQIPRTSLLRALESLESRNLLLKKIERGRVVVELVKK